MTREEQAQGNLRARLPLDDSPVPILGRESEGLILNQFLAQYDVPAYVRRGRRVQELYDQLLARCLRQREEWLKIPRVQCGILRAHAGSWHALLPWLENDEQLSVLGKLDSILEPNLRVRIAPTTSARVLRRDLRSLDASVQRFNRRWLEYLQALDLTGLNAERENYNRYYLLEKECAMRSARLAREGFHRLAPVTCAVLLEQFATLPVPRCKEN